MAKFKKTFGKIIVILLLLFLASVWFVSSYHYADGSRTGYLSKFSKKGYVFKTYEGELFVGGANADNSSLINNMWFFSVNSDDQPVIDSLRKFEGKIVRLHYYSVIKNMPWQGDQRFYIHKAEFVREK